MENKKTNYERPFRRYPELVPWLAEISNHVEELHKLLTAEAAGEKLGMRRQSFLRHKSKIKRKTI